MPSDGFDPSRTTAKDYESPFQKKSETGSPGRYAVTLDRGNIQVELTATTHVAYHRYTYPAGATTGHVVLDLDHHLSGGSIDQASFTLYPAEQRIRGEVHSMGGMSKGFGGYQVFFEIRARTPWSASQVWSSGAKPAPGTTATGTGVGLALDFDLSTPAPIELEVGLSLVSGEAAAANIVAELPAWSYEETAKQTTAAWDTLIGKVAVKGGSPEQQSMVTAAMYHAFLMPTVQRKLPHPGRALPAGRALNAPDPRGR
jgi:putative alpha-1,2-mannosidase